MIDAGQEVVGTALLAGLLLLRVGLAVYALVSGFLTRERPDAAAPSNSEQRPDSRSRGSRQPVGHGRPRAHWRRFFSRWRWWSP